LVESIPKGEFDDEDPLTAARREFEEETGQAIDGEFICLAPVTQKAGKEVHAWAIEGDIDPSSIQSNLVEIEWPPKSGRRLSIPEVDKAEWFPIPTAESKINPAQKALLQELEQALGT
jgi:predicted NUDIX family NTP pyrophosphohydrolase